MSIYEKLKIRKKDCLWLKKRKDTGRLRCLVVGDVHFPFEHPNYLKFLVDTAIHHKCEKIISVGDIIDNHALSFHDSETCAMSPIEEFSITLSKLKTWYEIFPEMTITEGNHDAIPERLLKKVGLPGLHMRTTEEKFNMPDGWKFFPEIFYNNVLIQHGIGSSGKYGAMNSSSKWSCSFIQGHVHSGGGVFYQAGPRNLLVAMNVGCGIDAEAYAFAYGRPFRSKPTLGCGVMYSDKEMYFVPMNMEIYGRDMM